MRRLAVAFVALLSTALAVRSETLAVTGDVRDTLGQPIAGATVELYPVLPAFEVRRREALHEPQTPTVTTRSDASGRYELAVPEAGMWQLEVAAEGFVPRAWRFLPLLGPEHLPVAALEHSASLVVRVVDPRGQPVALATVTARPPPRRGDFGEDWHVPQRLGVTDEEGRVRLPRTEGEELHLVAFARGFLFGEDRLAGGPTTLALQPGCSRSVHVTAAGKPFPGAVALAVDRGRGVSNEEGRLEILSPCGEETAVDVLSADGRKVTGVLAAPTAQGVDQPLALALPELRAVSGRVVAADSKDPVAGAFFFSPADPGAAVRSDERGSFSLGLPQQGTPPFVAAAAGFLAKPLEGRSAAAEGGTVELTPGALLGGLVVDAEGQPVAGARAYAVKRGELGPRDKVWSNRLGRFRLVLIPGQAYALTVSHDEFAPATATVPPIPARAPSKEMRIVLERGRSASGRVVDLADLPVAGAQVALALVDTENRHESEYRQKAGLSPVTRTDAQGSFAFDHLAAGFYDLAAVAPSLAFTLVRGLRLAGSPGHVDLGTVILRPAVGLDGEVTDEDAKPLSGAEVEISAGLPWQWMDLLSLRPQAVITGRDGRFTLSGLMPETQVEAKASKEGWLPRVVAVNLPASEPVKLVLQRAAQVKGRVVDRDQKPVAEALLRLMSEHDLLRDAQTDHEGRFLFSSVRPGSSTLSVSAGGFLRLEKGLDLEVGTTDVGTLVLDPGAKLEGLVTGAADSLPLAGAVVRWKPAEDLIPRRLDFGTSAASGRDGQYKLSGVPLGRRTLVVAHPDHQDFTKLVDIQPGMNRLDVQLEAGLEVRGRVVNGAGEPVGAATVLLSQLGTYEETRLLSGWDGSFRFPAVPPGNYWLEARMASSAARHPEPVQVGPDSPADVELRLEPGGTLRGRVVGLGSADLALANLEAWRKGLIDSESRAGSLSFEGDYLFEGLNPGEWEVQLNWRRRSISVKATVQSGTETVRDIEVPGDLTLSGRVERAGRPVANAKVVLIGSDSSSFYWTTTAQDGTFHLDGLSEGAYTLSAEDAGRSSSENLQLDQSREVLLRLTSQRVAGRVVDENGAPVAEAQLSALAGEGFRPVATSRTGPDGSFVLDGLAAGSVELSAVKEGFGSAFRRVELFEGDLEGVLLELTSPNDLDLKVTDSEGRRLSTVVLALFDPSGAIAVAPPRQLSPDMEGRVAVRDLPRGRFRLTVAGPGVAFDSLDVTIPAEPLEVVLPPGGHVIVKASASLVARKPRVSILDLGGSALRLFSSLASRDELHLTSASTTLWGIPTGPRRVRLTLADGQVLEQEVTVSTEAMAEVSFE